VGAKQFPPLFFSQVFPHNQINIASLILKSDERNTVSAGRALSSDYQASNLSFLAVGFLVDLSACGDTQLVQFGAQ
jgi:hypothetical protein